MSGWVQLLIILLFAFGPILSKILQTIAEKQQEAREKKRREVAAREAETAVLRSGGSESSSSNQFAPPTQMSSAEESRRAEIARRRQEQLEAWRSRQQQERGRTPSRADRAGPTDIRMQGDMIEGQRGETLVREALGEPTGSSASSTHSSRPPQRSIPARPPGGSSVSSTPRPTGQTPAARAQRAALDRLEQAQRARRELEQQIAAGRTPTGEIAATAIGTGERDPYHLSGEDLVRYHRVQFLREMLESRESLRQAFLLKEILDRPVGLREAVGHADWS